MSFDSCNKIGSFIVDRNTKHRKELEVEFLVSNVGDGCDEKDSCLEGHCCTIMFELRCNSGDCIVQSLIFLGISFVDRFTELGETRKLVKYIFQLAIRFVVCNTTEERPICWGYVFFILFQSFFL